MVESDTPAAAFTTPADTDDAIDTLPKGMNPVGCTAFFNSFKYVVSDSPTCISYE